MTLLLAWGKANFNEDKMEGNKLKCKFYCRDAHAPEESRRLLNSVAEAGDNEEE